MKPSAARNFLQRDIGNHETSHHEQRHLHDVRQCDRFQPAVQRVGPGKKPERHKRILNRNARYDMHSRRAKPKYRGEIDQDVEPQPEHGHHEPHARAVAALQEFRHRVDLIFQENRQKELAHDQERQRRHPFIGRDTEPQRITRARHADDLFGGNVRRDQRRADSPPGEGLARQKIVLAVLDMAGLLPRHELRQQKDGNRVADDNGNIDCAQAHERSTPP